MFVSTQLNTDIFFFLGNSVCFNSVTPVKLPAHGFYADVNSREGLKLCTHRGSSATLHGLNTLWLSSCCFCKKIFAIIPSTGVITADEEISQTELLQQWHPITVPC